MTDKIGRARYSTCNKKSHYSNNYLEFSKKIALVLATFTLVTNVNKKYIILD